MADRDGEAIAAIAVVLPASQQPVADSVVTLLREAARNVSRELGAPGWPPTVASPSADVEVTEPPFNVMLGGCARPAWLFSP